MTFRVAAATGRSPRSPRNKRRDRESSPGAPRSDNGPAYLNRRPYLEVFGEDYSTPGPPGVGTKSTLATKRSAPPQHSVSSSGGKERGAELRKWKRVLCA